MTSSIINYFNYYLSQIKDPYTGWCGTKKLSAKLLLIEDNQTESPYQISIEELLEQIEVIIVQYSFILPKLFRYICKVFRLDIVSNGCKRIGGFLDIPKIICYSKSVKKIQ